MERFEIENNKLLDYYNDFGASAVIVPETITHIISGAFFCSEITSLYLPKSVKIIEPGVCQGCSYLQSIEVSPDNLYYTSVDGVLFNKDQTELLFFPSDKKINSYQIPDTVKVLKAGCFECCSSLKKLIIPDSVKKVEDWAFSWSHIKELIFSDQIEYFGENVFKPCNKLEKIYIRSKDKIKYIILCGVCNFSTLFHETANYSETLEDKLMEKLSRNGKIELSLSRLYYQNELSEERKIFYQNYLARTGKYTLKYCIETGNEEYLRIAVESGAVKKSNITWAIDYAREKQNLNMTAFFMNYQHEKERLL